MRSYIQLELRSLLASRGVWVLLLTTGPLVGFSLIQAISLYNEASRNALVTPQMAAGLNPFDGVIIPTYGSIYLTLTLLFPFVAIRTIAEDKQSGALRLLLQLPSQLTTLLPSKVAGVIFAWLLVELPGLLALLLWGYFGGHLYAPEILCLLLGQFLYGMIVMAICFVSAAATDTASTAALLALGCTLGSWVLEAGPVGVESLRGYCACRSDSVWADGIMVAPRTIHVAEVERVCRGADCVLCALVAGAPIGKVNRLNRRSKTFLLARGAVMTKQPIPATLWSFSHPIQPSLSFIFSGPQCVSQDGFNSLEGDKCDSQ